MLQTSISGWAVALAVGMSAASVAPALAEPAPVGVLAPSPAPTFDWAGTWRDVGVATAASGAVLGLGLLDGGHGTLSALGPTGQLLLIGAAGTLPPAVMVGLSSEGFTLDAYMASVSGGLVGLGLGYVAAQKLGGEGAGLTTGLGLAAVALLQGLGSAAGHQIYRWYRPTAIDLDRLPEQRRDDPIENWNLRRERQNP